MYPVKYILNESIRKDKNSSSKKSPGKSKSGSDATNTVKELLEHKIGWLSKLDVASEGKELFQELKNDPNANLIQVHMARLNSLDIDKSLTPKTEDSKLIEKANEAIELADFALDNLSMSAILGHFAIKQDSRPDAAEIRKDMEKQKTYITEALARKGTQDDKNIPVSLVSSFVLFFNPGFALCILNRATEATPLLLELLMLLDIADPKIINFSIVHAESIGHLPRALKLTMGLLDSKPGVLDVEKKILSLIQKLGWEHVERIVSKGLDCRYPDSHELF